MTAPNPGVLCVVTAFLGAKAFPTYTLHAAHDLASDITKPQFITVQI